MDWRGERAFLPRNKSSLYDENFVTWFSSPDLGPRSNYVIEEYE